MEETLDQISPILPIDFFSITMELHRVEKSGVKAPLKSKHQLPDLSKLLFENRFADLSIGWHPKGLVFHVEIRKRFDSCSFPEFRKGDSVELFIDTRDLKSAGFPTRFCHHFVILPQVVDEISVREVTAFRTDDRHELCDPNAIQVTREFRARGYFLKIFIPSECLHGYDSASFDRLGFAYRINRSGGDPQHLAISSDYLSIESQPSLWSSMQMREK